MKSTQGVNLIDVLHAAFARTDPKSAKKTDNCWYIADEIEPRCLSGRVEGLAFNRAATSTNRVLMTMLQSFFTAFPDLLTFLFLLL